MTARMTLAKAIAAAQAPAARDERVLRCPIVPAPALIGELLEVRLRIRFPGAFEPAAWQGDLCTDCLDRPGAALLQPLAAVAKDEP